MKTSLGRLALLACLIASFDTSPLLAAPLAQAKTDAAPARVLVLDEDRKPLHGASIQIFSGSGSAIASEVTDSEGSLSVVDLPRGRHLVRASRDGVLLGTGALRVSTGQHELTVIIRAGPAPQFSEDVVVSAEAGLAQETSRLPQSANSMARAELDSRAQTTLARVANEEAGLYWQRTSPTLGAIFVRGLTGAKVNLFIDGVRYSNAAQRGGVNTFFNLLDPGLIDSVEVTRGPSSTQYGSDALGGSVQLFSRAPSFPSSGSEVRGRLSFAGGSADRSAGGDGALSWASPSFSVVASGAGRSVGEIRAGKGLDSHHAVTRFFGIPSSAVQGERTPDTDFNQIGGSLRAAWAASANARILGSYYRSKIDGSKRYDQLLGGDGNLIADVRDLEAEIATVRFDHLKPGVLDFFSASYSFNSQYEERVNQGGNGNATAAINHEPEDTRTHAFQIRGNKAVGKHTFSLGGDLGFEKIVGQSTAENATTHVLTPRRGRVPDGATYRSGGIYVQDSFDPTPKLHLVGALRASFAKYESTASTAPIQNGRPLWPGDKLDASAVTFRAGGTYEIASGVRALAHVSRGFRAPHTTDLATLGLTGTGFEASYDAVAPLGARIGTTADANAISTGRDVAVLEPEKSLSWEFGFHVVKGRFETRNTAFWNDIKGNIEKYAAILPAGAVGRLIGGEPIVSQQANGVVFVGLSSTVPVLIRANQENSRIFGLEHEMKLKISEALALRTTGTYIKAELKDSGLPPTIEGGTPNPNMWISLRWTHPNKNFYIEPYANLAAEQKRLSSLDLGDRRTGAARSRTAITAFFNNGARARGYVSPGNDGAFGTADDTLRASGETLAQILTRVLGPSGATNSLYTSVHGYQVYGVRAGVTIAKRHRILLDLENIADENYRGPSWGMDAAGRNLFVRYSLEF
jgi:hemoglobin/transferrin/lactoferrin receptor protein